MRYNIPERALNDITAFANNCGVDRVILFGSRARGDNHERSDIDIAVQGGRFDDFYWRINEEANTLLCFDIINLQECKAQDLLTEIEKDGVTIYEKNKGDPHEA